MEYFSLTEKFQKDNSRRSFKDNSRKKNKSREKSSKHFKHTVTISNLLLHQIMILDLILKLNLLFTPLMHSLLTIHWVE